MPAAVYASMNRLNLEVGHCTGYYMVQVRLLNPNLFLDKTGTLKCRKLCDLG